MALLVINYFLAAFLFAFSYYVDFKNGDRKRILTSFCMSAGRAVIARSTQSLLRTDK